MSFEKIYYGVEDASASRRRTVNLGYAVILLVFYGCWTDFVPSASWFRAGLFIALAASAVCTIFFIYAYATGKASFRQGVSALKKGACYLILPLIFFGLIWVAVVHGIGSALTHVLGSQADLKVHADKEAGYNRRSCDFRIRAAELKGKFPPYLCVSESQYARLPARSEIILHGRKSALGFRVRSWQSKSVSEPRQ